MIAYLVGELGISVEQIAAWRAKPGKEELEGYNNFKSLLFGCYVEMRMEPEYSMLENMSFALSEELYDLPQLPLVFEGRTAIALTILQHVHSVVSDE